MVVDPVYGIPSGRQGDGEVFLWYFCRSPLRTDTGIDISEVVVGDLIGTYVVEDGNERGIVLTVDFIQFYAHQWIVLEDFGIEEVAAGIIGL